MTRPRLLVLGGGRHQVGLIHRAEQRGIETVVSDYYPDAPGKAVATHAADIDALDVPGNIRLAAELGVAGVITTGTDMPVGTMAAVAADCGLPSYIGVTGAEIATNKALAHAALIDAGGARPRMEAVRDPAAAAGCEIPLPVVVKPADSQGQRGVRLVDRPNALSAAIGAALAHSRAGTAVIEEMVDGPEITANAWVSDGTVRLLAVADRITYNPYPSIGIAFRHRYPSRHAAGRLDQVARNVEAAAVAYGMTEGPLYVQMLVRGGEIVVVEAGARVGGGHEAALIPAVTGVDVIDPLIDLALSGSGEAITHDQRSVSDPGHGLVNFLLARPGRVARLGGLDPLPAGVIEGGFYIGVGADLEPISDGQGRIGYFIATADDAEALIVAAEATYSSLEVIAVSGADLLHHPEPRFVSD